MAQPEAKLLKAVDTVPKRASILSIDRDFLMEWRHALLMQLATIEKKLGISRRCKHCGENL
jgi:hypothetical protein